MRGGELFSFPISDTIAWLDFFSFFPFYEISRQNGLNYTKGIGFNQQRGCSDATYIRGLPFEILAKRDAGMKK
jgi:hypothetical protein